MAGKITKAIKQKIKRVYVTRPLDALIDIMFEQIDKFAEIVEKSPEEAEELKNASTVSFITYHTSFLYNKIGIGHRAITTIVGHGLHKFNEGAIKLRIPYIIAGASLIPVLLLPKEALFNILKSTGAVFGITGITTTVVMIAAAAQKKETADFPPPYKWITFIAYSAAKSIIFVGINSNLKKMFNDFLEESISDTVMCNLLAAIFASVISGIMIKLIVAFEAQIIPEQVFVILEGRPFKIESFEANIMADSIGSIIEQTLNALMPEPLGLMLSTYYKMITSENAADKGLRDYTKSFLTLFVSIKISRGVRELVDFIGQNIENLPEHLENLHSILPSIEDISQNMDKAIISIQEVLHAIATLISSIIEGKEHAV